ncbi:metalloregulator ArsR/SmtB family transcription factor [Streptomyces sp. NPDC006274]|uniref:ArsR/SmtB family transcription factor n=1 Tax=unclassified Streptomyces TaxID=2593676 RepID=UPI0033AA6BFC
MIAASEGAGSGGTGSGEARSGEARSDEAGPAVDRATADFLKALASETRQSVMRQFTGGRELTVGEIAERCGLKPSTASEHLSLLRRGGLVLSRKEGKQVFYRADGATMADRLDALRDHLLRCCPPDCGG